MNISNFPLVSIIIPFYNHNHFIKQTLDSILQDTYPNKAIVIINDGSSDPDDSNILKWLQENSSSIETTYIKRENKGLTKTLNELIGLAKGKYICLCASDDYLINNTLTKRVEILENQPNKKVLISDNIVIDDASNILYNSNLFEMRKGRKSNYYSDFGLKYELIKRWGLSGACFIANKDIYGIIGKYDESLTVEDWDFFLRAVAKNLIVFYDEKVSAYRLHQNSTNKNPDQQKRMTLDLASTAKNNIKNFKSPYFKYLLWKRSRRALKGVKRLCQI